MKSTKYGYVDYSDNTLRSFTKEQLIEEIKCLRHNLEVAHERCENQYKLLCKVDVSASEAES